jgi:hypothetical protein
VPSCVTYSPRLLRDGMLFRFGRKSVTSVKLPQSTVRRRRHLSTKPSSQSIEPAWSGVEPDVDVAKASYVVSVANDPVAFIHTESDLHRTRKRFQKFLFCEQSHFACCGDLAEKTPKFGGGHVASQFAFQVTFGELSHGTAACCGIFRTYFVVRHERAQELNCPSGYLDFRLVHNTYIPRTRPATSRSRVGRTGTLISVDENGGQRFGPGTSGVPQRIPRMC